MKKKPSLVFCVLMDVIGAVTYFVPFFGEWGDTLWAPLSAVIFYYCFGGKTGLFGAFFNFVEEILPFSDFVPSYCLGYLFVSIRDKKNSKLID